MKSDATLYSWDEMHGEVGDPPKYFGLIYISSLGVVIKAVCTNPYKNVFEISDWIAPRKVGEKHAEQLISLSRQKIYPIRISDSFYAGIKSTIEKLELRGGLEAIEPLCTSEIALTNSTSVNSVGDASVSRLDGAVPSKGEIIH